MAFVNESGVGGGQTGWIKLTAHLAYETKCHVQNWASCDGALVCRGDMTLWLSTAVSAVQWRAEGM